MRPLLLALALVLVVSTPAFAKHYKLDDDAAIRAAVNDAAHVDLEEHSMHCTRRMDKAFAKVVLIGLFANDRGCMPLGYFADGEWVSARDNAAPALALAGWSDTTKRVALATRWAEEAILQTSLRGATKGGDDNAKASLDARGGVVVEGWYTLPVGMNPVRNDAHVKLVFSPSGAVTRTSLETKSTPM